MEQGGKNMKKIILLILSFVFVLSCSQNVKSLNEEKQQLKEITEKINNDFESLIPEIDETATFIESLYQVDNVKNNLKLAKKENYELSEKGVFYKKNYENTTAVFVSGAVPVDEKIKEIVYFTEPLDDFFKDKIKGSIVQIYYNDENSYNRIYPSFDVLTQYEPGMAIPDYNFYYLANEKYNPEKKAVWVNEPYVDPAGRGWMVSLIKPVYFNNRVVGVPGIDITINTVIDKYLTGENQDILIFTKEGTIVATSEKIAELLSLPLLKDHKYIETIKSDTYLAEDFNLIKSKNKDVRLLLEKIIKDNVEETTYSKSSKKYTVISNKIKVLDWICIKFVE